LFRILGPEKARKHHDFSGLSGAYAQDLPTNAVEEAVRKENVMPPLTTVSRMTLEIVLRTRKIIYASDDGTDPRKFRTDPFDLDVFREVCAKIVNALHQGKDTVDLNITPNRLIVRDPDFHLPPLPQVPS
jgi:hypothetical protein